jgi:hypothetical protein
LKSAAALLAAAHGNDAWRSTARSYPAAFAALVDEVYWSRKEEDAFRRDWFIDCTGNRSR